ncbi:HNH endonuclease [Pseudoclavibacter sp. CFCC 14310]|uniref:HNH endonuclease n=1 Tax=Pseudoclavibacter sp. CFCC 14310 TaxID=2615180 RepID=UPI0013019642|nr:HNH endonuclease [Pseudoclavibacter sp. CFCC 14310]KAB1647610.1 HNH endonuclease [Pseudoclavibacter sp. CFCC 14310]
MPLDLNDYLQLTPADARAQLESLSQRSTPLPGQRQVTFTPVETLLSFGASFRVNGHGFGGANIARVPAPIPQLARLFRRSSGSIIRKMSNLDGSSPNGAKNEVLLALELTRDIPRYLRLYQTILLAARQVAVTDEVLTDFLDIVPHGEPVEIDAFFEVDMIPDWQVEQAVQIELPTWREKHPDLPIGETERLAVTSQRIGQQRFAKDVLANYQRTCAFCGLSIDAFAPADAATGVSAHRLLIASHIKPWKDATSTERIDTTNGICACPTHDAAFDQGLITVNTALDIELALAVRRAVDHDQRIAHNFGERGLRTKLLVPGEARQPKDAYLRWHREHLFAG